jgi:hypothetical protein
MTAMKFEKLNERTKLGGERKKGKQEKGEQKTANF